MAVAHEKSKVMKRIGQLLDQCRVCPKGEKTFDTQSKITEAKREKMCGGCNVFEEIKQHRSYITGNKGYSEKCQEILNKGEDMTRSDIEYLVNKGVTRLDIMRAVRMGPADFGEMLKNYGFNPVRSKGIYSMKFQKDGFPELTVDKYKEEKMAGHSDAQVREKYGISRYNLIKWKRKTLTNEELEELNLKGGRKKGA